MFIYTLFKKYARVKSSILELDKKD